MNQALDFIAEGYMAAKPLLYPALNVSSDDFDALVECYRREADEMDTHMKFHRICCQKKQIASP